MCVCVCVCVLQVCVHTLNHFLFYLILFTKKYFRDYYYEGYDRLTRKHSIKSLMPVVQVVVGVY